MSEWEEAHNAEVERLTQEVAARLSAGDVQGAMALCEAVLGRLPDHPTFRLFEATCAIHLGELDRAFDAAIAAMRQIPGNPASYQIVGALREAAGDLQMAARLDEFAKRLAVEGPESGEGAEVDGFARTAVLWTETHARTMPPARPAPGALPLMMSTEVWGEAHTRLFLDYHVPSMLTEGNLPSVSAVRAETIYYVSLPVPDYFTFRAHPAFEALRRHADIRLQVVRQPGPGVDKYQALNRLQNIKLREAAAGGYLFCDPSPDGLLGEGSLAAAVGIVERGDRKAFLVYGPRVELEAFAARVPRGEDGLARLLGDRRALTHTVGASLHLGDASLNVAAPAHSPWPHCVHWTVPGEGLAIRAFHLYPIVMHPDLLARVGGITITMDNDFVASASDERADMYVSTGSDEFLYFSLARRDDGGVLFPDRRWYHPDRVRRWLERFCGRYNLFLASHPIRFQTADALSPRWAAAEAEGDALVDWLARTAVFDSEGGIVAAAE